VIESDLAIVGAGPAGLAAAARALERGLTVTLLDDNPLPGGQYFRQPPLALRAGVSAEHRRAQVLFETVEHSRLRYLPDATVWDAPEPGVLAFARGADSGRVRAATTILAAGAIERAVPFPGWTLPGVMTAGGVQNLIKSQRLLPGRRFLVAGNGPLLLVVADSILRAGGTVVEVVESARLTGAWRQLPRLARAPDLLRRGLAYRARLFGKRVPLRSGATIVEARGAGEVSEAIVAPIDAVGRVDRSRARSIAVDTIVVGFGLVPSVELPRLIGCRTRWEEHRGGFIPERSADLETTVPGVFAVGDGAGISGAEIALAEGQLAGLLAARRTGRVSERDIASVVALLRSRLARLYQAREAIDALWTPPASFLDLLTPETIVCRCEEVTVGELTTAIDPGDPRVDPVKATTRVTMGRCQGRNCLATVAALVARARGVPPAEVELPRARPPARPIVLGDVLHEPLSSPRSPDLALP
jgi:D-hydroxyproline dehydrogenase subunit alpha